MKKFISLFLIFKLFENSLSQLTIQDINNSNDAFLVSSLMPDLSIPNLSKMVSNFTQSQKEIPLTNSFEETEEEDEKSDESQDFEGDRFKESEKEFPTPQPNLRGYSTKPMKSQYSISAVKPVLNIDPEKMIDNLKYPHSKPKGYYDLIPIQAEVAILSAKVFAGGKEAIKALTRLNVIANQYGMAKFIHYFPITAIACKLNLMKKSEKIEVKRLCEALYSRTTNAPITNQHVDAKTGSEFGEETSFVVPRPSRIYNADKEIAKLRAGAGVEDIVDYAPTHYNPAKDLK